MRRHVLQDRQLPVSRIVAWTSRVLAGMLLLYAALALRFAIAVEGEFGWYVNGAVARVLWYLLPLVGSVAGLTALVQSFRLRRSAPAIVIAALSVAGWIVVALLATGMGGGPTFN